jgi:hypothetical protein
MSIKKRDIEVISIHINNNGKIRIIDSIIHPKIPISINVIAIINEISSDVFFDFFIR